MIQCGTHEDYEDPPRVPQITGLVPRHKKESLTEAITGAAVAVAKIFAPTPKSPEGTIPSSSGLSGLSPGKCVELRLKNLQQLKFIQQLMDDGVLSQSEFEEQKNMILQYLRKLQ